MKHIYIHYPFCLAKCPYCDFNSYAKESLTQDMWIDGILKEWRFHGAPTNPDTIFFGGGTPSLLSPDSVEKILNHIEPRSSTEITLEANPTTFETNKFKDFSHVGINRLSLGVQALYDADLKSLGRQHNVKDTLNAMAQARSIFSNVSFDLMYGRSNHTIDQWHRELDTAISMNPDHLSLYQLTIEEGTVFQKKFKNHQLPMPSLDVQAEFFQFTLGYMADFGYSMYEISNYSKKDQQSRHNLAYWRYKDYLGLGPGSHSRLHGCAIVRPKNPKQWFDHLLTQDDCVELSTTEQQMERLLMGMRLTTEGVAVNDVKDVIHFFKVFDLKNQGFLLNNKDRLVVSDKGRMVLNYILEAIVM
jgi:putative oxygen-independent coproporphyrinogen III oxidase